MESNEKQSKERQSRGAALAKRLHRPSRRQCSETLGQPTEHCRALVSDCCECADKAYNAAASRSSTERMPNLTTRTPSRQTATAARGS